MSLRAILCGAVGKAAELRTSKNGNSFATLSIRENHNGAIALVASHCLQRERDRSSERDFRRRADRCRRRNHRRNLRAGRLGKSDQLADPGRRRSVGAQG